MWCVCWFFLSGICSVSQGKMNLNRFFVHQSDRAIAVFSHSKLKWFSLRLKMNRRTFNSHGVTWKSNTNPVNGSHRIDLNRMLRLVFLIDFFFRWNAFEIGWSHTFTHTCLLKLYTNFRSLVLLGIVHTTYRSQRYDQTHNTILIVCNYRFKDHLSVYFKEKEKCSLPKQVRSRVVEKVIARLHYMELTEVNRNKTYDVERKTMISIENEEKKKTNNPIVITSHTVTSPGLHGRSDDRATINWSFICNSNCFSHWMHENHSIKCQLKPEMRTW